VPGREPKRRVGGFQSLVFLSRCPHGFFEGGTPAFADGTKRPELCNTLPTFFPWKRRIRWGVRTLHCKMKKIRLIVIRWDARFLVGDVQATQWRNVSERRFATGQNE
jgi:hypothetical protein